MSDHISGKLHLLPDELRPKVVDFLDKINNNQEFEDLVKGRKNGSLAISLEILEHHGFTIADLRTIATYTRLQNRQGKVFWF